MSNKGDTNGHIKDGITWLFGLAPMPRHRAEWMTGSDDVILEFLQDSGAGHNYRGISNNFEDRNIDVSYKTITRRVPKLEEAGLVRTIPGDGRYFAITEKGEMYLEGEIDLRDL
jgi:DNA-binding PadR family transcriptional regulator